MIQEKPLGLKLIFGKQYKTKESEHIKHLVVDSPEELKKGTCRCPMHTELMPHSHQD